MNDQAENSTPICPECIKLRKEIEQLKALVAELQQRLNRNSSNSSIPPSANPLGAPKRPPVKPTGRKQGGQKGHRGHHRQQVPPEQVKEFVSFTPEKCVECQTNLPKEASSGDPQPRRHQVAELPPTPIFVTVQSHSDIDLVCFESGQIRIR